MTKIAIVEDEAATRAEITSLLGRFAQEEHHEITVSAYPSADEFLALEKPAFDLILMDIELPGTDGMNAVRLLRERGVDTLVIFITNLAHYAVNGYSVNAFDFIVKPVTYFDLAMKLKRAFASLKKDFSFEFIIASRGEKTVINTSDLLYVEVQRHALIYHTLSGDYRMIGTIKSAADQLQDCPFAFCNQCYLVNLAFVEKIVKNTVFVHGIELLISGPRRVDFIKALNAYLEATAHNR